MKQIIFCLLLTLIFTSCTPVFKNNNELSAQATGKYGNHDSSFLFSNKQETQSTPNPGPFKLVAIKNYDGSITECWQARGDVGKFGGVLTVSTFGTGPKTFNLWAASDVESSGIGLLMFDPLVFTDAWTGQIICRLAKSFEISKDKCQYIFKLRKGLKWSDGHPLTADDVVFTFDTIVRRGFGNSSLRDTLSVYGKYPSVEKIDDLTIRFKTAMPFAPFLNTITAIGIAPKHIMEKQTKRPINEFESFWDINTNPRSIVCCGPFMLAKYLPGQRVELARNPNYHFVDKNKNRLPYLEKMVISIVPDQNTQLLKFYADEIDLLDIRSVRGCDVGVMKQKEAGGANFKTYLLGPDDGTLFCMFNLNSRKNPKSGKFYVDPIKQKWFNNVGFRQAINHAINRQRIVNNVLRGVGTPLFTAETPASLYFNKDLPGYSQDLQYAAKYLKQAGFIKKEDGFLYDSQGHKVEFTLNTNAGNLNRDAICQIIADDLKLLGISVNYQAIDFNILINKTANSLDWESVVMGLSGSRLEPYGGANVWKSDGRLHLFDQRLPDDKGKIEVSDVRAWEKEIDRLFNEGATTLDETKRHSIFNRYQQIVYEEQPIIYLYCPLLFTAVHKDVGNYKPTPLGISYTPLGSMHNIEEIYKLTANEGKRSSGDAWHRPYRTINEQGKASQK